MLKNKKINSYLILMLFSLCSFSQTKEELQKQKEAIEKDIKYTTELLNKTTSSKKKSLNYLNYLEKKVEKEGELLKVLSAEIKIYNKQITKIEKEISSTELEILMQEKELEKVKTEYARMIYSTFAKKGKRSDLMFIFSSKDFNQAYKRIMYLKQYSVLRNSQAKKILKNKVILNKKRERLIVQNKDLLSEKETKKGLILVKKEKIIESNNTKNQKIELLNKLKKSETSIKKQLKEKQEIVKAIQEKIKKIIEEEIKKAKINNNFMTTPESKELSSEFVSNKGKLPWPLSKGLIVQKYGKQKHSIFAGVETFNNGVDIATNKNEIINSVFEGVVSRIFFIKGEGKAVLINHGEYFSVYSGLKEVFVKVQDKVIAKQEIGVVITHDNEDKTELHFEIWKGYEKQNPSEWLLQAY